MEKPRMTRATGVAAIALAIAGALSGVTAAGATVASVTLLQPAPTPNLTTPDYTIDEFIVSGNATAYARNGTWTADGHWDAKPSTTADYTTRVLVRRPKDPAKFNGSVVVEWLNVSAGFDSSPYYIGTHDELMRDGFAWVGVSAQKVGVESPGGLKNSDPQRYGSLSHPGDSYSYDIFSDVARQLRNPGAVDLLGGLRPARLIAAGQSQSAARLGTYINAVQPLVKVFDGFAVQDRTQGLSPLFDGDTGVPPNPAIRTDLKAPIMEIQDEGDFVALRSHLARQDDTPTFREWEVAGAAHADEYTLSPTVPTPATKAGSPCVARANSAAYHVVVSASVKALDSWIANGTVPPSSPRLELGDPAAPDPIARDALGLGRGGIRLPEIDAPAALIDGLSDGVPPGAPQVFVSFCRLFGRTKPFTEAQLAALYPDHASYVRAFDAAADRLVAAGFGLPADVDALRAVAHASRIGKTGFFVGGSNGAVAAFGAAASQGDASGLPLRSAITGIDSTPTGGGYRLVAGDGGVFDYGDAVFFGSAATLPLRAPIVGIASTPTGNGYWLAGADGGVFSYGDAPFFGSLGVSPPPSPIVAIASSPWSAGYWLLGRDGTVTAFGGAASYGNGSGSDFVGIEPTPTGVGYWLVHASGRVDVFGDALAIDAPSAAGAVGIAGSTSGLGYRVATSGGAVRGTGDASDPDVSARVGRVVGIAAMG